MMVTGYLGGMRQGSALSRPAAEDSPVLVERRGSPRLRVLKKAKLIHPNNASVFDCTIRDISETGARVSCANTGGLPNELQLMFHAQREVRGVRIVWRRPGEMGVQFLTPASAAPKLHI